MGSTLGLRGQRLGRGKIVGFAPGYLAGAATARVQAANNLTISASRAAAVTMQPSVGVTPTAPGAPSYTPVTPDFVESINDFGVRG